MMYTVPTEVMCDSAMRCHTIVAVSERHSIATVTIVGLYIVHYSLHTAHQQMYAEYLCRGTNRRLQGIHCVSSDVQLIPVHKLSRGSRLLQAWRDR